MKGNTFSVFDSIKEAWAKVSGAKKTFWAIIALQIFAHILYRAIAYVHPEYLPMKLLTVTALLILLVIGLLLAWGMIYLGIQRARNLTIQASMISYVFDFSLFLKMIGLYILEILILIIPITAMIFPFIISSALWNNPVMPIVGLLSYILGLVAAIYLIARLYIAKAIVLAEKTGPVTAIKKSFAATKLHVWELVGLLFLNMGIFILSILPLLIGLIWSLPYLHINYGVVYNKLTQKNQ